MATEPKFLMQIACDHCKGTGTVRSPFMVSGRHRPSTVTKDCPECDGAGHIAAPLSVADVRKLLAGKSS
jgi:DnaJ-class molecular chaperone